MYDYQTELPRIFTEDGVKKLIEIRDAVNKLLKLTGAFRYDYLHISGDSWFTLACVDYLVETKELVRLQGTENYWTQYQVYTAIPTNGG